MLKRELVVSVVAVAVLVSDGPEAPISAAITASLLETSSEICLMPPERAGYRQTRGGGAGRELKDVVRVDPGGWPPTDAIGGDIMPIRTVFDSYPTFDAVAVDPEAGRVFFTDSSLSSMLSYSTSAGGDSNGITEPETRVLGPDTGIGFIAGGEVDPARKEVYAVNNDGGGVVVFSYDQSGPVTPVRQFETPHQSWGIALSAPRDEIAITAQQLHGVVFYRRDVKDMEPPIRSLRGYATGLADPHGIDYDDQRKEIVISNHGSWTELRPYSPYDPLAKDAPTYEPGRFEPPSLRVFADSADGNAKPLRGISGDKTGLNWPMGVEVDEGRDEVLVANYGDSSLRVYRRTADGNVAPIRIIKGDRTGIVGPVDVSIDVRRNEIWVANYADHTAVVFERDASGNVAPKRTIRNAPKGTPALAFTNASAAAYDTKRDSLIIPNCVSVPRVSMFARLANGNMAPDRVIEGQGTALSRTMHGVAYDEIHDEISIPVALGGAVLVFRGGAVGEEAPLRVIQGAKTRLIRPQTIAVDPVHDEIIVGDTTARAVFVFDRNAEGDVAPKRALYGDKTKLLDVVGVAVDPGRNVIVVATRSSTTVGLVTFNRLDTGNVEPRTAISGSKTGLAHFRQVAVDPATGRMFIAQQSMREKLLEAYRGDKPRPEEEFKKQLASSTGRTGPGFIGVWDINDNGDVPPRGFIQGPASRLVAPGGLALNPKRGEVYAVDGGSSAYFAYLVPQFFSRDWPGTAAAAR